MKNLGLKLFSLCMALLLYLFVGSESNTSEMEFQARVEVKNLPADKVIVLPANRQVKVTLRGPSFDVMRIAAAPPVFRVKMPDESAEEFRAAINRADLGLPPYVQVVSIDPPEMEFVLDQRVRRKFQVIVPQIGTIPEGFKVDLLRVVPSEVEVIGPQNELKGLHSVETIPLDVREVRSDLSRIISLRAPGELSELEVDNVQLDMKVSAVEGEKRFNSLSVEIRSAGHGGYTVTPPNVSVVVGGRIDLLKVAKKEQVVPYVRLTVPEVKGQKRELVKVGVDLPHGLSVLSVEPEMVELQKVMRK